jgi:hypothetical protein
MLREPTFFESDQEAESRQMSGQIAAIRLTDQEVMVNLETVRAHGLEDFALPILAHEIGHHVYVPGSLADNARMIAAVLPVLFGLPKDTAHLVANLYGDLLLNDRLQRRAGLDMAAVYRRLNADTPAVGTSRVWKVYTHAYERLWRLPAGTLSPAGLTPAMTTDAVLIARLIRHHAADWLGGARRFACILYPYLREDAEENKGQTFVILGLGDMRCAGGEAVPDGLTGIDPGELGDDDDDFIRELLGESDDGDDGTGTGRSRRGGKKPARTDRNRQFRDPLEYRELLRALGLDLTDEQATARYYRERALPHLVPFPTRKAPQATEPLAEGYETWDAADDLNDLDLFGSLLRSPEVVPGVTTVQRVYGEAPGSDPAKLPVDLYIGIDCSGSMPNPQNVLSYPALAGTILALSALRRGARVMVVLSGEPGSSLATDGFVADEREVLRVLTSYLGTGYTFGIHRLRDTFGKRKPSDRDVHILIVTDHDIFALLNAEKGWKIARHALKQARGGGTYVLNMEPDAAADEVARMRADGWKVHSVRDWEELVSFARAFARAIYEDGPR